MTVLPVLPAITDSFEGTVQNNEKHGGKVLMVVISAVLGGSKPKQQLKATIKFK